MKVGWSTFHVRVQILAVLCAIAAFVIIIATHGPEDGGHKFFSGHRGLGVLVTLLAIAQLAVGASRPALKDAHRKTWKLVHQGLGYVTMIAGK